MQNVVALNEAWQTKRKAVKSSKKIHLDKRNYYEHVLLGLKPNNKSLNGNHWDPHHQTGWM